MEMTEEQAGSQIEVAGRGDGHGPQRRPNRWLLPLIAIMVLGALWSFRGEATRDQGNPVDME